MAVSGARLLICLVFFFPPTHDFAVAVRLIERCFDSRREREREEKGEKKQFRWQTDS
jgi:hypothetical protein